MSFTNYVPPLLNNEQAGAMPDIIGSILAGYGDVYKAKSLPEQLKELQLKNKYYGPNMESQIGLRGAQAGQASAHAGLMGEQTRAAHMTNQYLPDSLKAALQKAQLEATQNQMFNDMLKQRLTGNQQNYNPQPNPSQDYMPGQGNAPFSQGQSPFAQPNPQTMPPQQNPLDFNQAPQLSNEDIINKKFYNVDTFTPKYKAYVDAITKNMGKKEAEQIKRESEQDMLDFKETSKAQNDLPVLNQALTDAMRMKEIIQNRPAFFGHWLMPERFAKTSTDPLSGEFQGHLVPQMAQMEKQLSEKGNKLALKISASKLPGFQETQQSALGKVNAIINSLQNRIAATENLAGGNIVRRGRDRYKFKDGHWFKLKKGDY